MSKVNLKEVAEKAGVSMMSVSRAINNKPGLNEKTRKRILTITQEMGYVPNILAGSLGRKGTRTIGIVVPVIEHTNFPDMLRGIENILSEEDFRFILACSYNNPNKEYQEISTLLQMQVDGIIWSPASLTDKENASQLIKQQGRHMVFMDRLIPDINADAIIVDDYHGAYNAVRHLIEQGYEKIAHITDDTPAWTATERRRAYEDAVNELGPGYQLIIETDASVAGGMDAMERILERPQDQQPDAVFGFNDPVAIGAGQVLRRENITPKQIGLVGYAATLASEICAVPMTSVFQDSVAIGQEAARTLLKRIKNNDSIAPSTARHIIKTHLIERDSSLRSHC